MRSLLLIVSFGLHVCAFPQKKILKQAATYEASELYELAAEKYMEALYQNATKPQSINGLKRTAQKVVDQKLSSYFTARNSSNLETAITQFEELISFKERLTYFSVNPTIPGYYFEDYESDKTKYLTQLKENAASELSDGNQNQVEELIKKIKKYDPLFDENELNRTTKLIEIGPIYERAQQDFRAEKWMDAWKGFSEVEEINPAYKETRNYMNRIREKASSISIVVAERNRFKEVAYFKDNIIAEVAQLDNPLIQIIDRENLNQIIKEQKLGLSGMLDERSVADLGKILGVKAMVLIKIINYNEIMGTLNSVERTAYTSASSLISQNKFDPVSYREYSQTNKLQVSLQYQLISTETAEILTADIVREEYIDNLLYAKTTADHNTLCPAIDGYIYKTGPERSEFLALFQAERDPLSLEELEFGVQELLAKKVASSLNNHYSK